MNYFTIIARIKNSNKETRGCIIWLAITIAMSAFRAVKESTYSSEAEVDGDTVLSYVVLLTSKVCCTKSTTFPLLQSIK
jgi:hypothetical protein